MLRWSIAVLLIATSVAAEPTLDRGSAVAGDVLVPTGARWERQHVSAPALAPQIGAHARSALDVVAGRGSTILRVTGDGAAPSRWPFAVDASTASSGWSELIARPGERIAAVFGVTTFALDRRHDDLAILELRVRYRDGLAAWINGVEVARRALPRETATALAVRPHGPEWETLYVSIAPHLLHEGRNTLAVEVHPSANRVVPELELELVGRRLRGIVRGPVLADVTTTAAQIRVATDEATGATLEWGTTATLDRRLDSPPGTYHVFAVRDLAPATTVRYRVRAGASVTPVYTFHTTPRAGDLIRVGVYGDVRGGHATHQALIESMLEEPLDVVAVTGDMVLRGADGGDWQRFFTITAPLLAQVPYLPTVGNHDLGWGGGVAGEEVFALPPGPADRPTGAYWYSRDVADVHLVFLDSNAYDRLEQIVWLEADLAAARARGVRAVLVLTHDGPYSRGYHRGNTDARVRYVPIFARHRVDLVLAGHDHLYQRGEIDGVRYVVTGGGGASLYAVSCGVPGKRRCKVDDGMQAIERAHHFVALEIGSTHLELCARRPDRRLLEKCARYRLRR